MKLIFLQRADGSMAMGPSAPVPDDFDVQAWADKRRASLRILGVVRVVEQLITAELQPEKGARHGNGRLRQEADD